MKSPVCLRKLEGGDFSELSTHLLQEDKASGSEHMNWLDRYIGRERISGEDLSTRLKALYETGGDLKGWISRKLIESIYSDPPHPFIQRLQHPDNSIIYGYVMEHHHFLVQWVKSCATIISKTEVEEVQHYEIDNIISEFRGIPRDSPSHHELLLRMGESIGIDRSVVYMTKPLPATFNSISWWKRIADECHWVETMAAMHTMELTANPEIKKMGSKLSYFDPVILEDKSVPKAVKQFLYEGYLADTGHSMEALDLVEKYCSTPQLQSDVQSVVYKSMKLLDDYLRARVQRSHDYGSQQ